MTTSFLLTGALESLRQSPTMTRHEMVNRDALEKNLVDLYMRQAADGAVRTPYDALSIRKPVLPEQSHHVSDAQLEQVPNGRLDFRVVCRFDL